jgi:hypothetical protein
MTPAHRHILIIGTLAAISLCALLTTKIRSAAHAAEGDEVEYTFDRPVKDDEHRQWPEADAATKDATQLLGYSAAKF